MGSNYFTHKKLMKRTVQTHLKKTVHLVSDLAGDNGKKNKPNVEKIHQLRTETRRADLALRLFEDWLPTKTVDKLRHHLSRIRERAGNVRDLDVMMTHLDELSQPFQANAKTWLLKRAATIRADNLATLRHYCRHLLNGGLESRTRSLAPHFAWRKIEPEPEIDEFGANAVEQRAAKFFSQVDSLKTDEHQLHKVRIRGRQLRYTLDLLHNVLAESPVEAACEALSELQDTFGSANDQMFALKFINACASECQQLSVIDELRRVIEAFEITAADETRSAIREVLDHVNGLQCLLAEVKSQSS